MKESIQNEKKENEIDEFDRWDYVKKYLIDEASKKKIDKKAKLKIKKCKCEKVRK